MQVDFEWHTAVKFMVMFKDLFTDVELTNFIAS